MKQLIQLSPILEQQLDAAITQAMLHGDEIVIPLIGERLVLTVDPINATIHGWLDGEEEDY